MANSLSVIVSQSIRPGMTFDDLNTLKVIRSMLALTGKGMIGMIPVFSDH